MLPNYLFSLRSELNFKFRTQSKLIKKYDHKIYSCNISEPQ